MPGVINEIKSFLTRLNFQIRCKLFKCPNIADQYSKNSYIRTYNFEMGLLVFLFGEIYLVIRVYNSRQKSL